MNDFVDVNLLLFLLTRVRKKVKFMGSKLKSLDGKKTQELLALLGDEITLPIDIEQIYKKLSIFYRDFDFTSTEEDMKQSNDLAEDDQILGAVLVNTNETVFVLCRKGDSENRKRFTLAHELAHCCLHADRLKDGHIEFRSASVSNSGVEYDANVFAGELLIPETLLIQKYKKMIAPLSDVLARTFGVSTNVMEKRLEYLKLPYYKPVVPEG